MWVSLLLQVYILSGSGVLRLLQVYILSGSGVLRLLQVIHT